MLVEVLEQNDDIGLRQVDSASFPFGRQGAGVSGSQSAPTVWQHGLRHSRGGIPGIQHTLITL